MKLISCFFISLLLSCQHIDGSNKTRDISQKDNVTTLCQRKFLDLNELTTHPLYIYDQNELTKWIVPTGKIKGVAIVAHGLNLRPSRMNPISQTLAQAGVTVLRISLSGHRGSLDEGLSIRPKTWSDDFISHYCIASQRSQKLKVPLYFVGYSLGALVGLSFMNLNSNHIFKKMLLIAPASNLHWYSKIPGNLNWFNNKMSLPSKNLKEYRSQPSTSLAAYGAMNEIINSLDNVKTESLNIPTQIIVDPEDELVNVDGIESRIKESNLSHWDLLKFSNKESSLKKTYHHLIIDEETLGKNSWIQLKRHLQDLTLK